jgi:post-segregation antitoxin (ccd killing protein)
MSAQTRKRTNVTLDADHIARIPELDVNLSRAPEDRVAADLGEADRETWIEENQPKLKAWGTGVEESGLPLVEDRTS